MHFDLHLRADIQQRLETLAATMSSWEEKHRLNDQETMRLREAIQSFTHTAQRPSLKMAGVDGSGDFPSVSCGDAFIYFTVARAAVYRADPVCGLREEATTPPPVFDFTWVPEEAEQRVTSIDTAFTTLSGASIEDVIDRSDYRHLKAAETKRKTDVATLRARLIHPHAADSGNLGIQLRTTAEMGAALRTLESDASLQYLLVDTTLSLPLLDNAVVSLFYEHLKRLCCVAARQRGIAFFALSKSHGLPGIEQVEEAAREKIGVGSDKVAEHWYLRIPSKDLDEWELPLTEGRRLPPPGAVTYLVRFHRTTPTLRLDMDVEYWRKYVKGAASAETQENERRIFEDLDYACHDQRCYGYPYPIKAGHDRASLTKAERVALRKQIVDAAVKAGMKRSLFRDASLATGHQ